MSLNVEMSWSPFSSVVMRASKATPSASMPTYRILRRFFEADDTSPSSIMPVLVMYFWRMTRA